MNFIEILYHFKILINPTFLVPEKREPSSLLTIKTKLDGFLNSFLKIPEFQYIKFKNKPFIKTDDSLVAILQFIK